MTTLQKTLITTAIAIAIGAGIYEASQASSLRKRIQILKQQHAEQLQTLGQERDEMKNRLSFRREDEKPSPSNFVELIKLRGEVGILRRQLAEANKAKSPIPVAAPQSNLPDDPAEQQKRMARAKGIDGRNYSMHFIMFASENQGRFPTNWNQIARYEKEYPVSGSNDFEMVYQKQLNRNDFGTNAGATILVREYLAWPTHDGKWGKIYGFADGHAQTVILPDGNFTAWEKENTISFNSEAK